MVTCREYLPGDAARVNIVASAWLEPDWALIRSLVVHPDRAGQGIGRLLTLRCIEQARLADHAAIALQTAAVMHSAIRLYEGLGFERIAELDLGHGVRWFAYRSWVRSMPI